MSMRRTRRGPRLAGSWLICCLPGLVACNDGEQAPPSVRYEYLAPETTDDGWLTDRLEAVGMRPGPLEAITEQLRSSPSNEIHSILVVKDGRLVFEEYFPGHDYCYSCSHFRGTRVDFDRNRMHNLHSVTKSVTSTLFGIALDLGYISSVDDGVFDYFPEYAYLRNEAKDRITLRHLLIMSAGLEWDESGTLRNLENDIIRLASVENPIEFVLARPMVAAPGTVWNYSGGWTNVLGQVIRRATDMRVFEFADAALFGPLGISQRHWEALRDGTEYVSGDLRLTPRDLAKVGFLFLGDGSWLGTQVVSSDWVAEATRRHVTDAQAIRNWHGTGDGYGYQWWNITFDSARGPLDGFFASGWGGQHIVVIRELRLMVVLTGAYYEGPPPGLDFEGIVETWVLPAVSPGE